MKILIDGDACPVISQTEAAARENQIPVFIFCDYHHQIQSDTSIVLVIDAGPDSVDYAVLSHCQAGDLVITQDYGLASLVLARQAFALHPKGRFFSQKYRPASYGALPFCQRAAALSSLRQRAKKKTA